jgi:hypothetical protein
VQVHFRDFGPDVPRKDRYVCGVDYLSHDFDLGIEDAFYLVSHLKNDRSSVCIFTQSSTVEFYIFDSELNVQIDGTGSGFWHASNLDEATAKQILRVASDGCEGFGSMIPGTDRNWDVF